MNRGYLIATEVPDWDRHNQPCAMGAAVEFLWQQNKLVTQNDFPNWTGRTLLGTNISCYQQGTLESIIFLLVGYELTQLKPYKLFLKCGSMKTEEHGNFSRYLYPP